MVKSVRSHHTSCFHYSSYLSKITLLPSHSLTSKVIPEKEVKEHNKEFVVIDAHWIDCIHQREIPGDLNPSL